MVSTFRPSTSRAGKRQALTARPSTSTVQAPHSPSPQPSLVPVRSSSGPRSRSISRWSARAITCTGEPFSVKPISVCLVRLSLGVIVVMSSPPP